MAKKWAAKSASEDFFWVPTGQNENLPGPGSAASQPLPSLCVAVIGWKLSSAFWLAIADNIDESCLAQALNNFLCDGAKGQQG